MKLIIQIPCFNESKTLPITIADLPGTIKGIDLIEYLVVDDGSTDATSEVARELGVHHILRFNSNRGLAFVFHAGLEKALELGADIIVNTDGDNQYCGADIPVLVQPILEGKAEFVIGDRQIDTIEHFSSIKKILQKAGSGVVRRASGTNIPDTTSGFRALTRDAAMKMEMYNHYTYTLETIIQAGKKRIPITSVPIHTNCKLRESRLIKSIPSYIIKSVNTIFRLFMMYEPLRVFIGIAAIFSVPALVISVRYLLFYINNQGAGHIQSLILAAILFIMGFQVFIMGLLADLSAKNRHLNEEIHYHLRKLEYKKTEKKS